MNLQCHISFWVVVPSFSSTLCLDPEPNAKVDSPRPPFPKVTIVTIFGVRKDSSFMQLHWDGSRLLLHLAAATH